MHMLACISDDVQLKVPAVRGAILVIEVTSYTELIAGIQARLGELGIRQVDFDKLAGFPEGLTGKAFGPSQVKRLGPEKLFDALRAASLKITLTPDPEQFEKMRRAMEENCLPRQANQARPHNYASPMSTHLLSRAFKHLSRLGAKARMQKMTKAQRSSHAQHAANTRWRKHRKRVKAAMKGVKTRKNRLALANGRAARLTIPEHDPASPR